MISIDKIATAFELLAEENERHKNLFEHEEGERLNRSWSFFQIFFLDINQIPPKKRIYRVCLCQFLIFVINTLLLFETLTNDPFWFFHS